MVLWHNRYYRGIPNDHFDGKHFFWRAKPYKHNFIDLIKWKVLERRPNWPKHVPHIPVKKPPSKIDDKLRVTYIGHATLLIQSANLNILTDPQFSLRASPFSGFGPKRVQLPGVKISDLPPIDIVFVSHNHYDHLDIDSLRFLWKRDKPLIITPLGNDKIIRQVNPRINLQVMDWEESIPLSDDVICQLLPSQHWSARTIWDKNEALWGSACFKFDQKSVLFLGDTGFDEKLFKKIKKVIDPYPDIVVLPIGSYEPRWFMSYAHMSPEEAWQAFQILEGQYLLPIHYDVFPLGDEPFGEALPRLKNAAGVNLNQILPLKVGENFEFSL